MDCLSTCVSGNRRIVCKEDIEFCLYLGELLSYRYVCLSLFFYFSASHTQPRFNFLSHSSHFQSVFLTTVPSHTLPLSLSLTFSFSLSNTYFLSLSFSLSISLSQTLLDGTLSRMFEKIRNLK